MFTAFSNNINHLKFKFPKLNIYCEFVVEGLEQLLVLLGRLLVNKMQGGFKYFIM